MKKEKKSDFTLKIFSLIIAIILWSYVMDEVNPYTEKEFRNVEVILLNVESLEREGIKILEPESLDIRVSISGRRSDIIKVKEEDITAQVDLRGYSPGENVKAHIYVQVPASVTLEDYSPREAQFTLDRIESSEKNVIVETVGELANGYVLGRPEISPQSIMVEGPRTWINSISRVLATVDVEGATDDINVSRPIRLLDNNGNDVRGLSTNTNSVDITIPVYRIKSVPIELQTINDLSGDYEIFNIQIEPSRIEIIGKDQLKDIHSISTEEIDINEFMENREIIVGLQLPEGVRLKNPDQEIKVTMNIEEIVERAFDYTLEDVSLLNLDENLIVREEDLELPFSVTIQGSSSTIERLEAGDIDLELDLAGLEEGQHDISVNVTENGFEVVSTLPESLNITLEPREEE